MVGIDSIVEVHIDGRLRRLNPNNNLLVKSVAGAAPKPEERIEIRKAEVKTFEAEQNGFELPEDYVKYNGKELEVGENDVEYDVDDEDLVWLNMINERRSKEKRQAVNEAELEKAIDRFEKASFFQMENKYTPPDEDVACCICNDGDDSNVNQIIFCDMCNIAVHQECYGVPYIPAGQWLCRRCQLSPSQPVKCALCPYSNGAFKQTSDNRWVHVVCALWLSEVHFANVVFLEPVEGVNQSLERRKKLTCQVCKRKYGACLQCSTKSCVRAFHVTCAIYSGVKMKVEHDEKVGSDETVVNRYAFCHRHSASYFKADPESTAYKKLVNGKIAKAQKVLNNSSKQAPQVSIPMVPNKKLQAIKDELNIEKLEDVLNYWSLKRKARCGVPLLRRLQVYHSNKASSRRSRDELDTDAEGGPAFKPQSEQVLRTGKLRNNLEKLRLLVELVKKREKFKLEKVQNYRALIESTLKPPEEAMEDALNKLIEKDHQQVFALPVSDDAVPGYSKIIKKPMDFQKMREKLDNGEYQKVRHLRADFDLMMENCAVFNRNNPYFKRYGSIMQSLGLKILKAFEQEEEVCSSGKLLDELPFLFRDNEDGAVQTTATPPVASNSGSERNSSKNSPRQSVPKSPNLKRLRDTKVTDFFKPAKTAANPRPARSPPTLEAMLSPRKKRPRLADKKRSSGASRPPDLHSFRTHSITETSSASDTGGATSTDENQGARPRLRKRSQRDVVVEEPDPLTTVHHNDVVWAPLNKERWPGRVIDRSFCLVEDEAVRAKLKTIRAEPDHSKYSLVMFFDPECTIRHCPNDEVKLLDVHKRHTHENAAIAAAFRRAKDFWDKNME